MVAPNICTSPMWYLLIDILLLIFRVLVAPLIAAVSRTLFWWFLHTQVPNVPASGSQGVNTSWLQHNALLYSIQLRCDWKQLILCG